MNIEEDYVSYEVAKLLKEKGFYQDFLNEITPVWKLNGNKEELVFYGDNNYPCEWEEWYFAPTLQMACKWLREVHNLCIEPYRTAAGYLYTISTIPYGSCKCNPTVGGDDEDSGQWTTYEGAVEAAIKYTLENMI